MRTNRLENAERRVRAARALVHDLEQAVADEKTLAMYYDTGAARMAREHHGHRVDDLEQRRARRALEDYALRHAIDDDVVPGELRPLIDQATDAGLGLATIGALAEGRQP